ncbi:Aldehyde/histidinol dehydrogenase [Colletotrichum cereale]|nr:Aldehyde/histidinol dehydrogenase [Colletotrichum cereale]
MSGLSVQLSAPNGVKYTQHTGLFINTEFVESAKGETIDSIDPATGEKIAAVQRDEDTDQGPQGSQVSEARYERVLAYVSIGKEEGATLAAGDELPLNFGCQGKEFFVAPTVYTDVTTKTRAWDQEIFGPAVGVARFKTEEDAIRLANDGEHGVEAAVLAQDSDPRVPFDVGVKQSEIGRELGEAGLEAYSQIKAVHVNIGASLELPGKIILILIGNTGLSKRSILELGSACTWFTGLESIEKPFQNPSNTIAVVIPPPELTLTHLV